MKNLFALFGIIVAGLVLGGFMPAYALINKVTGVWQLAMYVNGAYIALVTVGVLFTWTFKKNAREAVAHQLEDELS